MPLSEGASFAAPRPALVIIYNHRHEQNIDLLERIYRDRFTHIFHLMPFYAGKRANVIPVYGSSYVFQGFVAQSLRDLLREGFTHYFFVADDLILNPSVNERNFLDSMGLPEGHCYLPGFHRPSGPNMKFWGHAHRALDWRVRAPGLEVADQIPSVEEARDRLSRHRVASVPLTFRRLWRTPDTLGGWLRTLVRDPRLCARYVASSLCRTTYNLPYPLASGYSDIFIVTSEAMREFGRLCGIFAASGLFVEYAIPTALALSADTICESPQLKLRGRALQPQEQNRELDRYCRSLKSLLDDFPAGYLFLHPIKLSGWVLDLDGGPTCTVTAQQMLANSGMGREVDDLRCDGSDLCVRSTGEDPALALPKIAVESGAESWAVIEITVPRDTIVQLYFQTCDSPHFGERNSVRWRVSAGRHRLVRRIGSGLNGYLRIDPGTARGDYRIHLIEVRQHVTARCG